MTTIEITVKRDIFTAVGIVPAGGRCDVSPAGGGRWLLWLWPPQDGRRGRARLIGPDAIHRGRGVAERLAATERRVVADDEYRHAREVLGMSNDQAVVYVARGIGVSLKTLRTWGYDTVRAEQAELTPEQAERKRLAKRRRNRGAA